MMTARQFGSVLLALCIAAASGCGRDRVPQPALQESAARGDDAPTETTTGTSGNGLGGSAWRLVKISSMDDTVHMPSDPAVYTLEFLNDGTARIQADCNRGTGPWTSDSPGKLQFGVIASTQAICPPGSMHDTYMAQFQWVRSYVIENGRLYLATMADGSIIEFEPAAPRS